MLATTLARPALAAPEATGLRFGADAKRTRIVIDLDSRVTYAVGHLAEPERLVVDLDEVRWNLSPTTDSRPKGLALNYRHGLLRPRDRSCNGGDHEQHRARADEAFHRSSSRAAVVATLIDRSSVLQGRHGAAISVPFAGHSPGATTRPVRAV